MIIEERIEELRKHISDLLVCYRFNIFDREGVCLDLIEVIATRLNRPTPAALLETGDFVRSGLNAFLEGRVTYGEAHARFTAAALSARLETCSLVPATDGLRTDR